MMNARLQIHILLLSTRSTTSARPYRIERRSTNTDQWFPRIYRKWQIMTVELVAQHVIIKSHSYLGTAFSQLAGDSAIQAHYAHSFRISFGAPSAHPTSPPPTTTLAPTPSFNQRRLNRLPVVCLPLEPKQFQFNFSCDDEAGDNACSNRDFRIFCKKNPSGQGQLEVAVAVGMVPGQAHCKLSAEEGAKRNLQLSTGL